MTKTKIANTLLFSILMLTVSCTKGNIKRNGCKSDALMFHNDSGSFMYPNVFTPNGDGVNDFFGNFGGSYESFYIEILDGKKVIYESNEPNLYWDGANDGKDVREGIYDYHLETTIGGISVNETRSVTVLRDLSKKRPQSCDNCSPIAFEIICGP
jgi:gliding motility-associated-like protein